MLRLRRDYMLFPQGRRKAFTLSFDDGVEQDQKFIEMLKKYQLKGTFNINTGLLGDRDWLNQPGVSCAHYKFREEDLMSIYDGCEVALHSHTHPDLVTLPAPAVAYEVIENKAQLERIFKRPIRGMAYPMGTFSDGVADILQSCGVVYARTTKPTYAFSLPDNFLKWHPTCHHTDEKLFDLAEAFLSNERAAQVFYVWGHTYEMDAFDDWERMDDFLEKMANHTDIWYATNMEIYRYVEAYKQLIYSADASCIENPTAIDVWIEVDGNSYRIESGKVVRILG